MTWLRALIAVTVALIYAPIAYADDAEPAVLALVVPSHGPSAKEVSERVHRATARVAAKLSLPSATLSRRIDLSARLQEARALWESGSLDEAAVLLDVVLEEGVRDMHHLARPADLVGATLWRVAIALARDEGKRAAALLDRLLRYDPGAEVDPDQSNPRLADALTRARATATEPPRPEDLGDSCRDYAIVITGRIAPSAGGSEGGVPLELFRYDGCKLVARVIATGDDDLSPLISIPPDPAVIHRAARARAHPRPQARAYRIAGLTTAGVGLVLGGIGTYYRLEAVDRADALEDECQDSTPCDGELVRERERDIDSVRRASTVLWIGGAAALAVGGVLYFLAEDDEEAPLAHSPRLLISPDSVGLGWAAEF